jgi:hypothetical protein
MRFDIGCLVEVAYRSKPHRPGGVGRITAKESFNNQTQYSVKYVLGGRDVGIDEADLSCVTEASSPRTRKPTDMYNSEEISSPKRKRASDVSPNLKSRSSGKFPKVVIRRIASPTVDRLAIQRTASGRSPVVAAATRLSNESKSIPAKYVRPTTFEHDSDSGSDHDAGFCDPDLLGAHGLFLDTPSCLLSPARAATKTKSASAVKAKSVMIASVPAEPPKSSTKKMKPNDDPMDDEMFIVEQIVAHRGVPGKAGSAFLVRWKGYGSAFDSWEPWLPDMKNNLVVHAYLNAKSMDQYIPREFRR